MDFTKPPISFIRSSLVSAENEIGVNKQCYGNDENTGLIVYVTEYRPWSDVVFVKIGCND